MADQALTFKLDQSMGADHDEKQKIKDTFKISSLGSLLKKTRRKIRVKMRKIFYISKFASEQRSRILKAEKFQSSGWDIAANQSILFFTTHKCASTFVSKLLAEFEKSTALSHFDFAKEIYRLGDTINVGDNEVFLHNAQYILFKPIGEIYGPLRFPIILDDFKKYRAIFFLRDPRDVAVSAYYSFGFSHGIPANSESAKIFMNERNRIREEGIDKYALRAATDWLKPLYNTYDELRKSNENSLFLRYEDFVSQPVHFSNELVNFLKAGSENEFENIKNIIVNTKKISNASQQAKSSHQRSGKSRQYLAELKPETVDELNHILHNELRVWDFTD